MGRIGYVLGVGAVVLGLGLAALILVRTLQRVEELPSLAMPGSGTVELPAGSVTGYGESTSGSVGVAAISARCDASDAHGAPLEVSRPAAHVSYRVGGRDGLSLLELELPVAGPVTIRCETATPFRLVFGVGVGSGIVAAVASVLGGLTLGVLLLVFTWRRRQQARARREQGPLGRL